MIHAMYRNIQLKKKRRYKQILGPYCPALLYNFRGKKKILAYIKE